MRLRVQRTRRNTWKAVRMLFLSACFLLLTGVRIASAQCYTFSSGSAASLTVNITIGQTTYTPSSDASLIMSVSSDSTIDFSAFDLNVSFITADNTVAGAGIAVAFNGPLFPNGTVPAPHPPWPGSFDPFMVVDVTFPETDYTPDS